MEPLAIHKIIHSIGDDMGMEQRPVAGEILVFYGLARSAELIYDLLHMNGVPDHRSVADARHGSTEVGRCVEEVLRGCTAEYIWF